MDQFPTVNIAKVLAVSFWNDWNMGSCKRWICWKIPWEILDTTCSKQCHKLCKRPDVWTWYTIYNLKMRVLHKSMTIPTKKMKKSPLLNRALIGKTFFFFLVEELNKLPQKKTKKTHVWETPGLAARDFPLSCHPLTEQIFQMSKNMEKLNLNKVGIPSLKLTCIATEKGPTPKRKRWYSNHHQPSIFGCELLSFRENKVSKKGTNPS